MNFVYPIRTKILLLGMLALSSQALADECGQSGGGRSVKPRIDGASAARDEYCKDDNLGDKAEKCKGDEEGDKKVTEDASDFKQQKTALCESAKEAIQEAQGACDAHKKANNEAEEFNKRVAEMKANPGQKVPFFAHGMETSRLAQELGKASGKAKSAGEKVGKELEKVKEAKKPLDSMKDAPKAQADLRDRLIVQKEKINIACNSNVCEGPTRAAALKARKSRREVGPNCSNFMAEKKKMDEMQEELKKKLESLKEGVEQLSSEALAKGEVLKADAAKDGANMARLPSENEKAALTDLSGGSPGDAGEVGKEVAGDGKVVEKTVPEKTVPEKTEPPTKMTKEEFLKKRSDITSSKELSAAEKGKAVRALYREFAEPYAREWAEKMIPADAPYRKDKVDEAMRAAVGNTGQESDFGGNRQFREGNNLAGLGGKNPGVYNSVEDFFTRDGNPNGRAGKNAAGYYGYAKSPLYGDAAKNLRAGNTYGYYSELGRNGFCNGCQAVYAGKQAGVYQQIYGYYPPGYVPPKARKGSSRGRSMAFDFERPGATGSAGSGSSIEGMEYNSIGAAPSYGFASNYSSAAILGSAFQPIGETPFDPGRSDSPFGSAGSKFEPNHFTNSEAAQRNAASIGALVWSEPGDSSKINLELARNLDVGIKERANSSLTGPAANSIPDEREQSERIDLDVLAASEETLFQAVHRRYRTTKQFEDSRPHYSEVGMR